MIRKLFLLGTLFVGTLMSGEARVIETERPVDVTGTVTVETAPGNSDVVKGETLFLTSGDTATLNGRRWPVKKVPIFFGDHPENNIYYKAARAAAGTGKPVTLHGAFQWNRHDQVLYFEID